MKKLFFLIGYLLLSSFSKGQTLAYSNSSVFVNRNHDQIIINDYHLSTEDYCGLPKKSVLYNMPLDCEKGIVLNPSNNFSWSGSLTFFYGEDIPNKHVFIYNKTGLLLKQIDNAELFIFLYDNYSLFIRETKIIGINLETGKEDLIYEFDKVKYTFHNPLAEDGPGLPGKFNFYWGGIRGKIFSTDNRIENGFTFVIDPQKKELLFWLQGDFSNLQNVPQPVKGIIKNDK